MPGSLNETQLTNLENIMQTEEIVDKSMALALSKWNNPQYQYDEIILEPSESSARMAKPNKIRKDIDEDKTLFKVFPNPALDYVTLSYNCKLSNLSYTINDLQSRLIIKSELETIEGMNTNEVLINLSNLSPGTYQIIIRSNEVIEWIEKLIIAK